MNDPKIPADQAVQQQFRAAMRRLAASVSIVVAQGDDGPVGMAATSITTLTSLHALLEPAAPLAISLLSRDQKEVSAAFGGALRGTERFGVGIWNAGANGLPQLEGAQANLECVIDAMLAYATHSIVIARVLQVRTSNDVDPLIYQDGGYL